MIRTFRVVLVFCFLALLLIFMADGAKSIGRERDASPSSILLKKTAGDYWQFMLDDSLYLRMRLGLKVEKLPDITVSRAEARAAFAQKILDGLKGVNPEDISHEEWLSLEILKWEAQNIVDGLKFYWLSFPVTPYSSPLPLIHRVFMTYPLKGEDDLVSYLALLKKYPVFIRSLRSQLESEFQKKIILPREEIELVLPFLTSFIKNGEDSLFYVKDPRLKGLEEPLKKKFRHELAHFIDSEINPSLKELTDYINAEYSAQAPTQVGLWQYPDGKDCYRYCIRLQTTLSLSPEEIHKIGLDEVRIINQKIQKIKDSLGFAGSMEEFRSFLKTDSRFFPKSPEEIGEKLGAYAEAISKKMTSFFLREPKSAYGVKRLDPELEGAMTYGYYDPPSMNEPKGIYYYNGSRLNERSLLWAEALIYHELIPGHHYHFALQMENGSLPDFRRETYHNAFNEGWAEYASWLGLEMGLYQDPYSLCGKYMNDLFLTTRLVVDTGMNEFGWPRSRAVQFMRENLIESPTQIHSETLRYSVDMPGQALGYKLGSLKMSELRKKAEKALGERFDIRKFHEALVGSGSMPIPVLEKHIDWFIKNELSVSKN